MARKYTFLSFFYFKEIELKKKEKSYEKKKLVLKKENNIGGVSVKYDGAVSTEGAGPAE